MTSPSYGDPRQYITDDRPYFEGFDPTSVPSPAYVIDKAAVEYNLQILRDVADRSRAKVLLALKAYALPETMNLIRTYLDGACASGVYEAMLAKEAAIGAKRFEIHTFAPAYSPTDMAGVLQRSDHVVFNSLTQIAQHREAILQETQKRTLHLGLRINPECSLGKHAIYDPCSPYSRLGITRQELDRELGATGTADAYNLVTGLHFHTLCEDDSYALEKTLEAVHEHFGDILLQPQIGWLNIGGGHHITKPSYDRDHLVDLIGKLQRRYDVDVIVEPGEAVAIHSGILVSSVLAIHRNRRELAILDTSATAHMPDTLEMPYRPDIWGAGRAEEKKHLYRFGGQTCLAGDVIGDYSFDTTLNVGDRVVFDDMSHYTMVKTTTFNGIPLPSIVLWDSKERTIVSIREPEYADFRSRLGGHAS